VEKVEYRGSFESEVNQIPPHRTDPPRAIKLSSIFVFARRFFQGQLQHNIIHALIHRSAYANGQVFPPRVCTPSYCYSHENHINEVKRTNSNWTELKQYR